MGCTEKSATGCFVDTAALDSDESVFHDIDTANTVLAGNLVAVQEKLERIRNGFAGVFVGEFHGNSLGEFNSDDFGFVGSGLGRDSHFEHGVFWTAVGIFQHSTFIGSVEQVLVNGVVGLGLGIDGDGVLGAVGQQVRPTLERLDELGIAPGSHALDGGAESLAAHFESNLIVSLSGGAVADVGAALFIGDADHFLGDARSCDGGSEEVPAFVESVALDGLEDVVSDEFLAEIADDALGSAAGFSLGLDSGEVFFVLTDVGAESDNLESFFGEPFEDNRGIKASRVGEEKLGLGFTHGWKVR